MTSRWVPDLDLQPIKDRRAALNARAIDDNPANVIPFLPLIRKDYDDLLWEVARQRREIGELQSTLIDNTHELRTALFGESNALPLTPKQAWEDTLAEVRRRAKP